jgi:bacterioferritin-associated ferredoxin
MIVCICNNISSGDILLLIEKGVVTSCKDVYNYYQIDSICSFCPKQICNVIEEMKDD